MSIQLLANTGFESGPPGDPWVFTATAPAVAVVVPDSAEPAHTGSFSAALVSSAANSAAVSQTIPAFILPGTSLRLSFSLRREGPINTDITAQVTLAAPFPVPVITIDIPNASNPGVASANWEYYEGFSAPMLLPAFSATVTITVGAGDINRVIVDDIFLVADIL